MVTAMLNEMTRIIDTDIVNLSGGLFGCAHVTAPIDPEPEPVVPNRAAAVAQGRRARRAARIVGIVAAAVMVGGIAAAHQAAPSTRVHESAPTASLAQAQPPARVPRRGGGVTSAPLADEPAAPVSTPALPSAPAPAAEPRPALRHVEPAALTVAAIPVMAPAPSPLEALGAARTDFDRPAAAISLAAAARSAGACLAPEETGRTARVHVTFSPSGRATSATVDGGPLTGTAAGACVARALRGARVHAFGGEPVAVATTVHL
jgi:hypothetical protein